MAVSLLVLATSLLPASARAGILSNVLAGLTGKKAFAQTNGDSASNIQSMPLPQPAINGDQLAAQGGGDIAIADDSVLVPQEGPSGTIADIVKPKNGTITRYVVQPGDTISSIAAKSDVSVGTIVAANNLKRGEALQPGQVLVILPITSITYTVKTGDTLESIAKRYGGNAQEIASYNGVDDATLAVGSQILIPNGEVPAPAASPEPKAKSKSTGGSGKSGSGRSGGSFGLFANNPKEPAHDVGAPGSASEIAYYIAPLAHYIRTQGIHGYNAVDLAAPVGTPIMASAAGDVVVARDSGWNGGYGEYVVIAHDNGSETLYAHMSSVSAYDSEHVVQGQVIGYVGETGEATGPHVHFEIRDGIRNPF